MTLRYYLIFVITITVIHFIIIRLNQFIRLNINTCNRFILDVSDENNDSKIFNIQFHSTYGTHFMF